MATTKTDFDYALQHKYRVVTGGEFVPGVTTIIGVNDKPALKWAAAAIAAEAAIENGRRKRTIVDNHRKWLCQSKGKTASSEKKRTLGNAGSDNEVYAHWCRGEFDRQWRAKADRGTRVHDVAERWSRGEAVSVPDSDIGFVNALETFHLEYLPKFHEVECIVINREHSYGGRFDAICSLHDRDTAGTYLIDYKTGGKYDYEVALQAEGYLRAKLAVFQDDGYMLEPEDMPTLDGARTIYLGEDGHVTVSDPFENISHDDAWRAFLACRELFDANKSINDKLGKESE